MQFRSPSAPEGLATLTEAGCCAACWKATDCSVWVHSGQPAARDVCYLLTSAVGRRPAAPDDVRSVGGRFSPAPRRGFTAETLRIESNPQASARAAGPASSSFSWAPGNVDAGNLLGTAKSLDGITGSIDLNCSAVPAVLGCALGPLSRDGWAVIDDTDNIRIDPDTRWLATVYSDGAMHTTAMAVPKNSDLYFFGFGREYKAALSAYTSIAGAAPRPPRFSLGVWWSRYWPYTAEDLEEIARGYAMHAIPLDVLVSDMAWHYHGEEPIEWGGYTWGPQLFPEPSYFLQTVDRAGLNLTLNLHLDPVEPPPVTAPGPYAAFVKALGLPAGFNGTIPGPKAGPFTRAVKDEIWRSRVFGEAYLDLLDGTGTNWWWLDDEPRWVARILYEHSATRMEQGMAFSRWAGHGSHRYPIGFSGDTYMEWSTLAFQPKFTATAANVLFYWSHDIGGHRSQVCPGPKAVGPCFRDYGHDEAAYDPELYLRWLQWGSHAPIMRTHPLPDPKVERRAWGYSAPISGYMRDAFARRVRLVPALHTANLLAETTGVGALHPLYYEWPDLDGAYAELDTFVFVGGLVVAPITHAVSNATQIASRSLWIPPGTWYDTVSGRNVAQAARAPADAAAPQPQGTHIEVLATLWEMPVFARAGLMLPLAPPPGVGNFGFGNGQEAQPALGGAAREPDLLTWEVYGVGAVVNGSGLVWEDFGGKTTASFTTVDGGKGVRLEFSAPVGPAGPAKEARRHRFELVNVPPASSVAACSAATAYDSAATRYGGASLRLSLQASVQPGGARGCIQVEFAKSITDSEVQRLAQLPYQGIRSRLHVIKQQFDDFSSEPTALLMPIVALTNTGSVLSANCQVGAAGAMGAWTAEMTSLAANADAALTALTDWAGTCKPGRFGNLTKADCADFAAQGKAWLCGAGLSAMKTC